MLRLIPSSWEEVCWGRGAWPHWLGMLLLPGHGRVTAQQGLQQPRPGGWKRLASVLSMNSSLGEALGLPGFVTEEAGVLPGCSEGAWLILGVLSAAGKHLCRLQCSTVAFFYPATGCT